MTTTPKKKKFVMYNTDETKEETPNNSQFKRDLRSDAGSVIRASLRKRKMKRGNSHAEITVSQTTAHVNGW